jgi:DegV family protein with EDD domain
MKQAVVVTDSSANIPADLVQRLDIRVVPILLAVEGRTFRDGVDVTSSQIYQWLRENKQIPTTSAPSIGDFLRVYAAAAEEAPAIVSIHLSPKLSVTYTAALAASQLLDNVSIRIVNCHSVAMGQGFVVLEAARAVAAGADLDAIVTRAEEVASRMNVLAVLGTLEYLYRGGRIGGAAAVMGTMLQIKPVVHVADGYVDLFARPRTKAKAIQLILKQMAEHAAETERDRPDAQFHAAILHADVPEEAEALREMVAQRFNCAELYVTDFTPVMGAHAGPGVLGVAYYIE